MRILTTILSAFMLTNVALAASKTDLSYTEATITKHYSNAASANQTKVTHQKVLIPTQATVDYYAKRALTLPKNQIVSKVSDLPSQVQLNMNGLPALDQGEWGSCVTFATTEALDAYKNLVDADSQISQTCTMQLARTVVTDQSIMNDGGWQGADSALPVLQIMQQYGEWAKSDLHQIGCGHLLAYPETQAQGNGVAMTSEEYQAYSTNPFKNENFYKELSSAQQDDVVTEIKQALARGHRVVVQVRMLLLPGSGEDATSYGNYNGVDHDTWMLNENYIMPLWQNGLLMGLHEMVITGYDDNAVVTGITPDGKTYSQKGVLTLRNSYGDSAHMQNYNDDAQGNHYMTYDYANAGSAGIDKILPIWVQKIYEIGDFGSTNKTK